MEWLDMTMNTLLNIYGLQKCVSIFGSKMADIPREETEVQLDSFIMDNINTLNIGENLNMERGVKEMSPPDTRNMKRRALVVYGDSNFNAWNTPVFDAPTTSTTQNSSKVSINLTKHDTSTSESNDTISQLSQALVFLQK